MTIQTNQLEAALDRLHARLKRADVAQLVPEAPGLLDDQRVFFDSKRYTEFAQAMAEHGSELERCLKQLRGLERQLGQMAQAASAVPQADRWREQSRIDSLANDLARVRRKAARAAFALLGLRDSFEPTSLSDLIKAVQDLLHNIGEVVDATQVRVALTQTTQNPVYRSVSGSASGSDGGLSGALAAQQLFAVVAFALVLARWFKQRQR